MTLSKTTLPKLLTPLLLLSAVACYEKDDTGDTADSTVDTGTPAAVDLSSLDREIGCSDLYMSRYASDGSLLLEASTTSEGLTETAFNASDKTATLSVDLATESTGQVQLHQGVDLHLYPCDDVIEETEEITHTWTATSGTLEFTVVSDGTSSGPEYPGEATVTLTGVVVTDADGASLSIPDSTWTGSVGWLPG